MDNYAEGFSTSALIEHYHALLGDLPDTEPVVDDLRKFLIKELRGTEFDEHAYALVDAAKLAQAAPVQPAGDAQGGTQGPLDLWPHGATPTSPPWV